MANTIEAIRILLKSKKFGKYVIPYVDKIEKDGDGNVIADTYLKTDMSNLNPTQTAKDTIVSWEMPDFSAGVSASFPFTAPKNGICAFEGLCNAGQYFTLFVNGNKVGRTCATQQTGNTSTLLFKVQKNDVITYEYSYNETSKEMTFFPLKGAN
jgi:hypothetical protein